MGWWKGEVRWAWDSCGKTPGPLHGASWPGPVTVSSFLRIGSHSKNETQFLQYCKITTNKNVMSEFCVSVGHELQFGNHCLDDQMWEFPTQYEFHVADGWHIWNGPALECRVSELIGQGHPNPTALDTGVFLPVWGNHGVFFTPPPLLPYWSPGTIQNNQQLFLTSNHPPNPMCKVIAPLYRWENWGSKTLSALCKTVHFMNREPGFKLSLYCTRTHILVNVSMVPYN